MGKYRNRGLIAGRIYENNKPAKNVTVVATRITGATGLLFDIQTPNGSRFVTIETDSKGRYALPFMWNGADLANDITVIWIYLAAYNNVVEGTRISVSAKAFANIKGVLIKDFEALANMFVTNPQTWADFRDFALDKAADYAGWSNLIPIHKTVQLWSTENWIIVGGTDLFLA